MSGVHAVPQQTDGGGATADPYGQMVRFACAVSFVQLFSTACSEMLDELLAEC